MEKVLYKFITLKNQIEFLLEFGKTEVFSFDIETTGLQVHKEDFVVNSIGFTLYNDSTWVLPVNLNEDPNWAKTIIRETQRVQREKKIKSTAANGKFDNMGLLSQVFNQPYFLNHDIGLSSHVFNENTPHDLKYLARVHCGAPDYDDLLLKEKLDPVKYNCLERFYQYQADDAYWTMQLYKYYSDRFKETYKLRRLYNKLVMPAARIFEEIDYGGLFIDLEKFEQRRIELQDNIARNERELHELYGGRRRINWGSPKQVGEVLFGRLGLPIIERTKTGQPGTGEDVLLELQGMHPIPDKLIEWRGNNKQLNTYIEGWEELMVGPMLYLSTKLHGTVTGRYSSRLHQVPRDGAIRNLVTAPEGWTFVVADFSQIELRIVAHVAQELRMIQIFTEGGDIHEATAKWVLMSDNPTKEQRKAAKGVNFGYVYGMWWVKFKKYAKTKFGVTLTDQQAKDFREAYFSLYSGLLPWHERTRQLVRDQGYVEYLSGRLRRLPEVYAKYKEKAQEAERQAINSPIQGFGSGDLKLMAIIALREHFDPKIVQLKGEVHDSILSWVRTDKLKEVLPVMKDIMENPPLLKTFKIDLCVPLVVDVEYGPWGAGEKYVS
jgi:DNA polymerase I-like protein with 3'-5' exonuclease and polymerase domains